MNDSLRHCQMNHERNHVLDLPVDIQLNVLRHLPSIYAVRDFLKAFPEIYPVFKPYTRSILNAVFWRPVSFVDDDRGVIYRWILRELQLERVFEGKQPQHTISVPAKASRLNPVICNERDVD
ncbi:uncharacterized protein TRUGW13939_06693 [Talaromyces rugulosus]|uniref:F-box domain-containing protein n=1 Tax=Talaromyces rugulosus TaxID=121627 RepID=A0A7H8R000_TALRU|nr:uncharacterized protein TRUGW13939_06693 [Talaromyces rugulosus]QKX59557.1 hypothetical protein TRUGW13939_06693 [Talaromyces rugulosus]